jgi:hypothetical protein
MNAEQQIDRFVAYVNEAGLPAVPRTIVLYRYDGSPIAATEVPLDEEVIRILDAKEASDYALFTVRELIGRKHASSVLLAHMIRVSKKLRRAAVNRLNLDGVPDGHVLAVNYESHREADLRVYPITWDAGAIRLSNFIPTPKPPRYFTKVLL